MAVACTLETAFSANGIITIKRHLESKAAFRLALRVTVWYSYFKVTVNGKILKGIPGTYLNLDETWNKNSTIKVSFHLKTGRLDGGISYPNSIAFKTGPQVSAIDQTLNPLVKNLDKVTIAKTAVISVLKILLTKGLIGSQVFTTRAMYNGKLIDLILVLLQMPGKQVGKLGCGLKNNTDYIFYNTYIYNGHEEKSKRSIKVDGLIYVVDYKVNKFFND